MSEGAEKQCEKYFNFDEGEIEFQGETAVLKGSLLFDFVHEFRQPNVPAIEQIGVQVKQWLEDHLRGSPEVLQTFGPLLKLTSHGLAYIGPEAYTRNVNDEIAMRKGFWLAVLGLVGWFTDDLDDGKTYRADPNFKTLNKFFSSTMYNIFNFQYSDKQELKIHLEQFGLFKNYPKFYDLIHLWFHFAQGFYKDPLIKKLGVNEKKMRLFGKALKQEYMSNSWMDGNGLEKVDSFHLYSLRRVHNSGGFLQITFTAIMDGFHEPELEYIFLDQHVEHFTFLCVLTISLVNDLLSLKKELKAGDGNNPVFIWIKKGTSLQESVNKAIQKHDQLLEKARELYNFLQNEYQNDAKLLGYLELVLDNFSGICQFQGSFSQRYGDVKWSIDREPKA